MTIRAHTPPSGLCCPADSRSAAVALVAGATYAAIGTRSWLQANRGHRPSKGAARRTIAEGGAYVNNTKIDDEAWAPQPSDFLHGRWLVLRRGKRNIAGIERVG